MEHTNWPPIKSQAVRVPSMDQTGVIDEVRGSGSTAMYVVALPIVGLVGKVRWQPKALRRCEIGDLEPVESRDHGEGHPNER